MATYILLTSETAVKETTSLSDNLAGKYLRPAIRKAQDINLRGILGDTLLAKLKALVAECGSDVPEGPYKVLLERCKYFLAFSAAVDVTHRVNFKIANAGVVKTPDENVQVVDVPDMASTQAYYQAEADNAALDLQNYILNNRADYPELTQGDCHRIHSNLYSAATCGIFLGGQRGKQLPNV